MNRVLRLFACFTLLLWLPYNTAKGEETMATDSLVASLLTCSPGEQIYEYYGHSALRIQNLTKQEDLVFNYGLFDYDDSNFIWRFVLGECDYNVAFTYFQWFLPQYERRGSFVRELQLNLTQAETHRLFQALLVNCKPENDTYRYNFFYDNCGTRILDQIQNCLDGKIIYTNPVKKQSLRDIVHQYSASYKWSTFGQDLLLGAETDQIATRRMQEFAPLYLEADLRTAQVETADQQRHPLVKEVQMVLKEKKKDASGNFSITPFACACILLGLTLLLCAKDIYRKKATWGFDLFLLSIQGIAGILISFMFFFSEHPTVDSNWLTIIFNPLPLIFLYGTIQAERKHRPSKYHIGASGVLGLFLLATPIIPQHFGITVIVLALCLLLRSCCYLYVSKRH